MSKTICRVTPVNGYDIPALEGWLEQMAAKGLVFSMSLGPLTLFEPAEPAQVHIHLEPAREKTDQEDPELTALYEQAGWRYLGIFRKNYFVFASEEADARAHTDPQVLDYALKRFLRQKLLGGVGLLIFNLFLLAFFQIGNLLHLWYDRRLLLWFPLETASRYDLVPLALTVVGLALVDLSYLLGLPRLQRYRRAVRSGAAPSRRGGRTGWLLAAGTLVLLPVAAQFITYYTGMDYTPYPLEGSGFVTLSEIEGPDFRLSGDILYNMDYISHGDTPLKPESWYFQQYGAFSHYDGGVGPNDVPHLEIRIIRYLLPLLGTWRMEEESRSVWNGAGYQELSPPPGVDRAMLSQSQAEWMNLPTTHLLLQRGNTVLLVDYRGTQDLTEFLPRFSELLDRL